MLCHQSRLVDNSSIALLSTKLAAPLLLLVSLLGSKNLETSNDEPCDAGATRGRKKVKKEDASSSSNARPKRKLRANGDEVGKNEAEDEAPEKKLKGAKEDNIDDKDETTASYMVTIEHCKS